MKKCFFVAPLMLGIAFASSSMATDFETYAGWSPDKQSTARVKLIIGMMKLAHKRQDRAMLECIQTKYAAAGQAMTDLRASQAMIDFQAALQTRARLGSELSVEKVAMGQILLNCPLSQP